MRLAIWLTLALVIGGSVYMWATLDVGTAVAITAILVACPIAGAIVSGRICDDVDPFRCSARCAEPYFKNMRCEKRRLHPGPHYVEVWATGGREAAISWEDESYSDDELRYGL